MATPSKSNQLLARVERGDKELLITKEKARGPKRPYRPPLLTPERKRPSICAAEAAEKLIRLAQAAFVAIR
jgi:hypothetical protein